MQSPPRSPTKSRQLELIQQALEEAQTITQSQQALYQTELDRQDAEHHLAELSQSIHNGIEDLSQKFQEMGVGINKLKETIASPPPSPSKTQLVRPSTPTATAVVSLPTTPTRSTAAVNTLTGRPARGTTLWGSPATPGVTKSNPVYPGSNYPVYVLYAGRDDKHGLFYTWKTYKDVQGVAEFYDEANHSHIVKAFTDVKLAQQFYQEFVDAEIPELLAAEEPSKEEHFIVIEGVKPGVCKSRKALVMNGLNYRGGVAYRFLGETGEAYDMFNQFKKDKLVKKTHPACDNF